MSGAAPAGPADDDERLDLQRFAGAFKRFLDAVNRAQGPSPFAGRLTDHLRADPSLVPVLAEELSGYEHATLQRALDALFAARGRRVEQVGIAGANKRYMSVSFSDLVAGSELTQGPVDWVNVPVGVDEVQPCVQFGLFLVADAPVDAPDAAQGERPETGGARYAVFVAGPSEEHRPDAVLRVEVASARREDADALLTELRELMRAVDVHRGRVLTLATGAAFGPRGPQAVLSFERRPEVGRDEVVLPAGLLDRIERHTVTFSRHAAAMRAAGRSLRRGVLLYGPPGVGKTLTVRYLTAQMPDRTVLLLTGASLNAFAHVGPLARRLAPCMVVLEDVDLIAEERTMAWRSGGPPLLFELLNEMDGLRDDADVVFVLTTNRADLLEPALAARPGRVDLSVELPLPDADDRRRLFELYGRGLDTTGLDWVPYLARTQGSSPAYVKELLRQATLHAVEAGRSVRLTTEDLDAAIDDLELGGDLARKLLGATPGPLGLTQPT